MRTPCEPRGDGQAQLLSLHNRLERRPDDRREPMRAAMSRYGVFETGHSVVSIKVSHLPVADAQRSRQRGTPAAGAVTAFEYRKRGTHRVAILALQHNQHRCQNLGKLPRSGRKRATDIPNGIFELRDSCRGIVDTQLYQTPPCAHK